MSQCYHIELKTSIVRTVKGEDSISYPIELTEILPNSDMKDLLKQQLLSGGWSAESEHVLTSVGEGGEILRLDLESMELTATISEEKEVVGEASARVKGENKRQLRTLAQRKLKEEEAAVGDRIEDAGTREIQRQVTERLAQSETLRQRRINEILQGVYAEALKRKAGSLGEILEVQESTSDDGKYELLIRIAQ